MNPASTRILTNTKDVLSIVDELANARYLAVDTETTGLGRFAEVIGVSISPSPDVGYYIPIKVYTPTKGLFRPWSDEAYELLVNTLIAAFTQSKRLITHNGVFDAKVIENTFKVNIIPYIFADTQLLHHTVIDESPPHGLKPLAVVYLDPDADSPQDDLKESVIANGGKWTKYDKDFWKGDWKLLGNYACFTPNVAYVTKASGDSELIENIKIGDYVISHTGAPRRVDNILSKIYTGSIYNFQIEGGRTIYGATEEHPFLVMNQFTGQKEWKMAKDIKSNDLLIKASYSPRSSQTELYNSDVWWLFGLYQADGYVRVQKNKKNVVYTLHEKECPILLSVLDGHGFKYSVVNKKAKNGTLTKAKDIVIYSKYLADLFLELSGGKFRAWDKRVTESTLKYLCTNLEHAKYFLAGFLDGDGSVRAMRSRPSSSQMNITTTSSHLSNIFDILCSRLLINCTRAFYDSSLKGRRRRFSSYIFTKGLSVLQGYFKIKKHALPKDIQEESYTNLVRVIKVQVENYSGPVYNISVNQDESYIVNGIITHNCYDTIYTYRLFNLWYPELLKSPKLVSLWNEEVMPLMAVTYDLNTVGIKIDVDYFKQLEVEMTDKAKSIEDEIFALIEDKIKDYEFSKIKESINITPRSEFGRFLKTNELWPWEETPKHREAMEFWYKSKNGADRVFNLDSPDDKAFLLFDVLGLPVKGTTAKGKRSVTKAILDELADQYEDSSVVLKLMRERSKELKLLGTYVKAILETHVEGRIYPDFNQTGTTSGRYSSGGNSINMQTLPREDTRIKKGFVADEGRVFIASDYSALEPRTFADVSGEPKLIETMKQGLDFYSSIAINVLGLTGVSANPADENYLGKVDKEKRQWVKAIALSIPYGASAGRLSQMMKIEFDEAKEVYDKYIKAFPVLKKWMDKCDLEMKMNGYVESAVGRRKRNKVVYELYNKYKLRDFSKYSVMKLLDRHGEVCGISDPVVLYLEARNALNVSKNHKVQSFAASVCNQAMVDFKNKAKEYGLDALVVLNVHDEIILNVAKDDAEMAFKLLKDCMTNNRLTRMMKVALDATPIVTDKNLSEAK